MKKITTFFMIAFGISVLFAGCSKTIQEKKSTATDPGNATELKFTGNKLKLVHDF